jgi:hypothetical protein
MKSPMPRIASLASPLLVACAAGTAAADLTPIALSGDPAPGIGGATFARLAQPRILPDGSIAFWARLEGDGITDANDGSIWSDRSGALAIAYREDGPAPFDADIRWGAFPFPAFNAAGDLSFTASLVDAADPDEPTNLGIFAEDSGFTLVVAREGFIAPGLPNDGKFGGLPIAPFSDAGAVAFNGSKGAGAWLWTEVDPTPIAIAGDPAPEVGPPWVFSFIDGPVDSGNGTLAFRASLIDPAKPKEPYASLWSSAGGNLTFIAWADPAKQGRYFTDLGIAPLVSDAGVIRFWAASAGDGVDASNDTSILQFAEGGIDLLVEEGSAAPGGGLFGQLPSRLSGNPAGDFAFSAPLAGPDVDASNNSGIYLHSAGNLALVAREGDQAPGLPGGIQLATLGHPAMGADGELAFSAHLRGEVEQGSSFALFVTDGGQPVPVVRTGDQVDVGGGDVRTVREIAFASGDVGSGYSQMAPGGVLVLHLTFEDKSQGLFIAGLDDCYADLDGSGSLDLFDFLAFVNLFNAGDPAADCDASGGFDLFDFLCFVNAFNAGC